MKWTDELTEQLKQLAAEGALSASQMGTKLGVGRNAVIGEIHREKFHWPHARTFPNKPRTPRTRSTLQDVFRQASEATDIAAEMITGGVTILELQYHHCRWPLSGHPKEVPPEKFLYCGADRAWIRCWGRIEHSYYCAKHYKESIQGQRVRVAA